MHISNNDLKHVNIYVHSNSELYNFTIGELLFSMTIETTLEINVFEKYILSQIIHKTYIT